MRKTFFVVGFVCLAKLALAQSAFKDISEASRVVKGDQNIGVAFSDFDGDGDEDFYVSLRDGANKLFENIDGTNFINIAAQAGVNDKGSARTSVWVDINNDGFQDLYVGNFFDNDVLYLNNGDKTFTNITRSSGINNEGKPFSINVADVDLDGFLDIYISNFQAENILYHNNGDNTFTNIVEQAGAKSTLNAMGAVFFDYDNDNDPDLYLTHDGQAYILYKNIGAGNFVDVSEKAGVDYDGNGMGTDVGDINQDGLMDIYITNLHENVLYLNNGDGTFSDISEIANVMDYGMGWGTNFLDYNNDGWLDIYVTNDSYYSPYPNVLYENQGDQTFKMVETNTALASEQGGYGSACADIDKDGAIDLVVANAGSRDYLQLFHNQLEIGHWIGFKLEGIASNRDAVGAKIKLIDENDILHIEEVVSGSGYASQSSLTQHFGLGEVANIKSIEIIWPSGQRQTIESLDVDKYYKVIEGEMPVPLSNPVTNTSEIELQATYTIFPNPTQEALNIEILLQESTTLNFQLFDFNGRLVLEKTGMDGISGVNNFNISLPELPNGNYQLKLSGGQLNFSSLVTILN